MAASFRRGRLGFGQSRAHVFFIEQDLALQVGQFNHVGGR